MPEKTVFNTATDNKIKIFNPRITLGYDNDNDMNFIVLSNYNIKIFFNHYSFDEFLEMLNSHHTL
jgi:hypothetical protein